MYLADHVAHIGHVGKRHRMPKYRSTKLTTQKNATGCSLSVARPLDEEIQEQDKVDPCECVSKSKRDHVERLVQKLVRVVRVPVVRLFDRRRLQGDDRQPESADGDGAVSIYVQPAESIPREQRRRSQCVEKHDGSRGDDRGEQQLFGFAGAFGVAVVVVDFLKAEDRDDAEHGAHDLHASESTIAKVAWTELERILRQVSSPE